MDSKCCAKCAHTLPLSSFLKDPSNPKSKSFKFCIKCRTQHRAANTTSKNKRKALQLVDPNILSKRPATARSKPTEAPSIPLPHILSEPRPEPPICPLSAAESRPQAPILIHPLPESPHRLPPPPVQPAGFLPADQWRLIQNFYTALDGVKMEYCLRCRERWFSMGLRNKTCDVCFLRDKGSQSPFLMSTDNEMDPGEVPAHLPALTQVEEMIIARSHVQMLVH